MTTTPLPSLKLRRIVWDDGSTSTDDYEVIDERGERIGRIYRTHAVGGDEAWRWRVYAIATTTHPPPGGLAPTREAAQRAFRAAWAKCQPRGRGG